MDGSAVPAAMSRQLVVFVENRPGALADLTGVLAEAGINIEALLLEGSVDFGAARLHVDSWRKAEKALRDAGFQVQSGEALVVRLRNEPGGLAEVTKKLAKAKINVESVFGTTGRDGEAEFVFMVDDLERARKTLGMDA